jgi:hypothetical protein
MQSISPSAAESVEALHMAGTPSSTPGSVNGHGKGRVPRPSAAANTLLEKPPARSPPSSEDAGRDEEKRSSTASLRMRTRVKRNWYGKKIGFVTTTPSSPREGKSDLERGLDEEMEMEERDKRPVQMYAPVYNGLAAGLAFGGLRNRFDL